MLSLIVALILTIFFEFLVYWLFTKKEPVHLLFFSILINCFTLPLATFAYQNILPNFLLIEFLVFLAEIPLIYFLFELKLKKALRISFAANLLTALIGVLFSVFWF